MAKLAVDMKVLFEDEVVEAFLNEYNASSPEMLAGFFRGFIEGSMKEDLEEYGDAIKVSFDVKVVS